MKRNQVYPTGEEMTKFIDEKVGYDHEEPHCKNCKQNIEILHKCHNCKIPLCLVCWDGENMHSVRYDNKTFCEKCGSDAIDVLREVISQRLIILRAGENVKRIVEEKKKVLKKPMKKEQPKRANKPRACKKLFD